MELDDLVDVPTVVAVPTVILPKAGCETTRFVNQEVLVVAVCRWWFQMCFFVVHPYLGKWSNLTHMFQIGWFNRKLIVGGSLMTLDIQGHFLRFGTWTPKTYHPNTVHLRRYDCMSIGELLVKDLQDDFAVPCRFPAPLSSWISTNPCIPAVDETKRRSYLGAIRNHSQVKVSDWIPIGYKARNARCRN